MPFEPFSMPLPIDWRTTLAAIDDVIFGPVNPVTHRRTGPSNPGLARAAARLHDDIATRGAAYDAAVTNNVVTLGTWAAELSAVRATLEARLAALYANAQLSMLSARGGWPWNPDGVVEAFTVDELPIARAATILTDGSANPVVRITARETGLVGNSVQVGIVSTGSGLRLDARRGSTVLSCDVPSVGADFVTDAGAWLERDRSTNGTCIGSLIERPTWIVGATNPPAVTGGWSALSGGTGAVLGRVLAEFTPERPLGSLRDELRASLRVRLVNDTGVLRPVPSGIGSVGTGSTLAAIAEAEFYIRDATSQANRVLALL